MEIVSGPSAGARLELTAGQTGLVGRASWAELSAPHDTTLAGQHFSVELAEVCRLKALSRQHAVFVNGIKVGVQVLRDGDEVKAGENTFKVRLEGIESTAAPPVLTPTPPPKPLRRPEPSAAPAAATVTRRAPRAKLPDLRGTLRATQPLFALIDAARDDRILGLLQESGDEHACLYEAPASMELAEVAPYLVCLPPRSAFLDLMVREGWGRRWGVFLTSHQSMAAVRKHFRHFLTVESEGEEYLFRFYDPGILRVFLPVCNAEEISQFFGPVETFFVEGADPAMLLKYQAAEKGVHEELVLLDVALQGAKG